MAGEMALILEAMSGRGRASPKAHLQKNALLVGGLGVLALLTGLVLIFWTTAGIWFWILSVWWLLLVSGLSYAGWHLIQQVRAYQKQVELEAREAISRVEGRYKALVQYTSDIFLILRRDKKLIYASPSLERSLGYKPTQVEGLPVAEFIHLEDRALVEGLLERPGSVFFTARFQHREGHWRYFEGVGQALFDDPIVQGYLITLRDITDRKREEAQRQEKEATALRLAIEKERAEYERNLIEQSRRQLQEAYDLIERQNKEIHDSLTYAARIQQGMLADPREIQTHLPDSFIFWRPRDVVSGDFYWFLRVEGGLYLAAADCTGHGVPGALMTMIASSMLVEAVLGEGLRMPDEILRRVHQLMRRALRQDQPGSKSEDGMEIALVRYEPEKQRLYYAGANRPLWIAEPGADELTEYKADRKGIGGASAPPDQFFTLHAIDLCPHWCLYMSSDGYGDQFGKEAGRRYMVKRFKRFLMQIAPLSIPAQQEALAVELDQWKGDLPQIDDILVIGFRVSG